MDIILIIIIILVPLLAEIGVKSNYKKYLKVNNTKKLTGQEVARQILDKNGLQNVYVVATSGYLSDHYDPTRKTVRLSKEVFEGETVASMSIAAHECGHAIQDKEGYTMMRIRSSLVPVVNLITYGAYIMFAISIIFQIFDLLMVSIVSVLFGLVFQIVTLPVEFDASRRGLKELNTGFLVNDEVKGATKVLKAAAYTYVASVANTALQILRLILIYGNRRRR